MKTMKSFLIMTIFTSVLVSYGQVESSQGNDFTSKIDAGLKKVKPVDKEQIIFFDNQRNKLPVKFELLPVGDIKPKGWIYDIMKQDITTGFVGNLDELASDIMKGDDLFNTTRRKDLSDIPDVGDQVLTGAAWEISMQWWSGESLGNWWDGYIRNAFLTDDKESIKKSKIIVDNLLSSQDKDGYIGIYGESMRFKHKGSNGELWTQTTVFRMLLAYYELTKDEKILSAVERAMAVTMKNYNENAKSPFNVAVDYGGVTHGLMMTDVCEELYRITKKEKYSNYAVYLYKEFSKYPINRGMNDVRYEYLLEKDSLFQSHSAHTYEHLRTLINAYYSTGYPELEKVFNNAMKKLSYCILPSGAGFGNEWLNKEKAKPDSTAAEFCGMVELRDFFSSAAQKTGDVKYADLVEKMTFNAMQGARNKDGTGITYCKTDNCYILNRTAPHSSAHDNDPRYKYSPTHADAAVCCNPSYAKHFPYYVNRMWMKSDNGIAAVLYGPSEISTLIKGNKVSIEQATNYPFSDEIVFNVNPINETEFTLSFRKPNWTKSIIIDVAGDAKISFEDGFYKVKKKWKKGDVVKISFENEILPVKWDKKDIYFQRGALVYAYNIKHREQIVKEYKNPLFSDYYCFSEDDSYKNICFLKNSKVDFIHKELSVYENPWNKQNTYLRVEALDTKTNKLIEIKLVPMGNTVLRRVTFPSK